jgi:hypothetical protein
VSPPADASSLPPQAFPSATKSWSFASRSARATSRMSSLDNYAESREEQEEAWDFSLDLEVPTSGLFAPSPAAAEDIAIDRDFDADAAEHFPREHDFDVPVDASLDDDPLELAAARLDAEWDRRNNDDDLKTSSIDSTRTDVTAKGRARNLLGAEEGRQVVPCEPGTVIEATDAADTTRSTPSSLPKRGSISLANFSESSDDDGDDLDDFDLPSEGAPVLSLAAKKLPPNSPADEGPASSATEEDDSDFFDDLVLPSYLLGPTAPTSQAGEGTPPTSEGEPESDHPSRHKYQLKTSSRSPTSTSRSLLPVKVDLQSILRAKLEQRGGRGLLFGTTGPSASSQRGPPTTPQEREKLERYRERPGELEGAEVLDLDLDPHLATGTAESESAGDVKTAAPRTAHAANDATERSQPWTAKEMRDRLRTTSGARAREAQVANAARAQQRASAGARRSGLPVRRTTSEASTPAVGGSTKTVAAPSSIAGPRASNIYRPGLQNARHAPPPSAAPSCPPREGGTSRLPPLPSSTSSQGPQRRAAGLRPSFSVSNLQQVREAEASVGGPTSTAASPAQGVAPARLPLRARHTQQHLSSAILPSAARAKVGPSTLERRHSLQNMSHLASPTPGATYVPPTGSTSQPPPPPRYGPRPSPSPIRGGRPSYAAPTAASANRIRERQMSSSSLVPPTRSRPNCDLSTAGSSPLSAQGSVADRRLQVVSTLASRPSSRSSSPNKPSLASIPRLPSSLTTNSMRSRAVPTRYTIPRPFPAPTPTKPYGDGTELDAFEDLPVSKELEKQRVVRPISRKSSGASLATAKSGSLGRKEGVKVASSLRHSDAAPPSRADRIDDHGKSNAKAGEPERKKLKRRREPHLIRHLGGNATVKGKRSLLCMNVVFLQNSSTEFDWAAQGEMTYNPMLQRWEGNESILRDFDKVLATSVRPALISPLSSKLMSLSGSSMGSARLPDSAQAGQVRASGTVRPDASASRASAKVVGGMVFDPATRSWHALAGPDAEEELELDWGGGTSGGENADDEAFGGDIASEVDGWELGERQRMLQSRASLLLDDGSASVDDAGGQALDAEQCKKSTKRRIWLESKAAEERCRLEMREWTTSWIVDGERDAQRRWLWDLRSVRCLPPIRFETSFTVWHADLGDAPAAHSRVVSRADTPYSIRMQYILYETLCAAQVFFSHTAQPETGALVSADLALPLSLCW